MPVQSATTLESLSRDLAKLIEERYLERPALIGHSLGGTLALSFAADHSDRIAGVVAVDGLPVFPGTEGMTGDRSALELAARDLGGICVQARRETHPLAKLPRPDGGFRVTMIPVRRSGDS